MPGKPNHPINFWQELKRRKVIRVITVYAAVAFVIIELVDIVAPNLGLPTWTFNLVLLLLLVGFVIAVIVSWIYDIHPDGGIVKTEPAHKIMTEDVPKSSNSWKIASYISFVIIIGLIAFNIIRGRGGARIDESRAKSIAVLPFQNFSEDPDQDFMCLGLTDEIISHLFKLESFDKVVSLTSVLNYRDPDRNIPFIGKELGVNYILEGTYKKIEEDLKVSAQLIEAGSDKHIWIQDYSRPYAQIMSVQSEIALQIAQQLNAYVSDEEQRRIEKVPTTSQEAFELYQMGRFFWNKRTGEGFNASIEYFEQAIKTDPGYGLAYAGLADTYILMAILGYADKWEGRDKSAELAFKALELDRNLSEAYTVLGLIYGWVDWDWEKAEDAFQNALAINPNYSTTHLQYAEYLSAVGQHKEARIHINKAVELDPLSFVIRHVNAILFYHRGHFEEALRELNKSDEILDNHPWTNNRRFQIYYQMGQEEKAFQALRKNFAEMPRYDLEVAEEIYQDSGMRAVLLWKIESDIDVVENEHMEYWIADDFARIGMYEEALYWLEKAFQFHSNGLIRIGYNIHFKSLRDNPRYQAIREGMGLGDYKY